MSLSLGTMNQQRWNMPIGLTKREMQLVLLLADGHNKESAGIQMGISINTVKKYMEYIGKKLRLTSGVQELVCWYYKTYWQPKP